MYMQRSEEWMRVRADKLMREVRMLYHTCNNVMEKITLVDVVQHLGINHIFEEQTKIALKEIHESEFSSSNLHEVALWFRLLREHGYWVSPDVFNKFKDQNGCFNKHIYSEPRGLLSLYNAAHLLTHGEPTLEEAITFARHHLEAISCIKSPLAQQVQRSLHLPLSRTCKRVEALHYISEYKEEEGHNPILLELAKLDFNLLQHIHLEELKAISKWWKDVSGKIELSYVRDRVVELYLWSCVVYYEEGSELIRNILIKIYTLITIIDDTYDARATIEECRKLYEASKRLDESAVSLLPDYLKNFYNEMLRMFKDMEGEFSINGNNEIAYLKKQLQVQFTYYIQEAEWVHRNYNPSFEEQVNMSIITIGSYTACVAFVIGMGDELPKEALGWADGIPNVIIACAKICRFANDIAAFKRGKSKGDIASSVECYMNENNVTRDVAVSQVGSLMEHEWRTLNQARFTDQELLPIVQRIYEFSASMMLFYSGGNEGFSNSVHMKKTIESFFVNPIPM